jgi:hypothetical protein
MTEHILKILTNWTGSSKTEELVREQIKERWGEDEAEDYDPRFSCRTLPQWRRMGMKIKPGSKALRSFVLLQEKDEKGKVIRKRFKTVYLFHTKQTMLANR